MTRCRLKLPDTTTEIQRWQKPPPVAQVRPTHCRHCHAASKPQGQPLVLVGHGLRQRQLRGPVEPQGPPRLVLVYLRRFLCRRCKGTMTVGPRPRQPGRLYSGSTILLALALWALCNQTSAALRALLCPWATSATGSWASLGRWVKAALSERLWRHGGHPLGLGSLRERVARLLRQWGAPEPGEDGRDFAHRLFRQLPCVR